MKEINKKGSGELGIGIIAMALLLLLGGIFFSDNPNQNQKEKYLDEKNKIENLEKNLEYPEENYLFYLNSTDIGRQNKVTQSFPNIELGSKTEYNTIYLGNNFRLNANMFTSNKYFFEFQASDIRDVKEFLISFSNKKHSGDEILKIYMNEKLIMQNRIDSISLPIIIDNNFNKINSDLKTILEEFEKDPFATIDEISENLKMDKKKSYFINFKTRRIKVN